MSPLKAAGCVAIGVSATAGWAVGATLRTVAATGQAAPGTEGAIFGDLGSPQINNDGTVLFSARLTGGLLPTQRGSVWRTGAGGLEVVLVDQTPAPGLEGQVFSSAPWALLAGNGTDVALAGTTVNPTLTPAPAYHSAALYAPAFGAGAAPSFVESTLPAPAEGVFGFTGFTAGSQSVAFASNNGTIIWSDRAEGTQPRAMRRLVERGAAAPGTEGATLLFLDEPAINRAGRIAFRATLDGTPEAVPPGSGVALFTDLPGALTLVARTGSPAPGVEGASFDRLALAPSLDDSGLTFWARLAGPGDAVRESVWRWTSAGPRLLAIAGGAAPGAPDATFRAFATLLPTNASGQAAVLAWLNDDPAENGGVWVLNPDGSGKLLAREGQAFPAGGDRAFFNGFSSPAIADSGRVTFLARLAGPGVAGPMSHLLLSAHPAGPRQVLVRAGDALPVLDETDTRTVASIAFGGALTTPAPNPIGPVAALAGSRDAAAFRLIFSDSSSAVVVATLPCPADFDGSEVHETTDVMAYLRAWFANDGAADYNADSRLQVADIFGFLRAWFAGC